MIVGKALVLCLVSLCPQEQQPPPQPPIESFVYEEQEEDGIELVVVKADHRTKLARLRERLRSLAHKTAFAGPVHNPALFHTRAGSHSDLLDPDQLAAQN